MHLHPINIVQPLHHKLAASMKTMRMNTKVKKARGDSKRAKEDSVAVG